VKSETTLVRAKGRVELNSKSAVNLNFTLIVLPCDAKLDDTLRNGSDFQSLLEFWVLLKERGVFEGG
jgi:hypothetical protein